MLVAARDTAARGKGATLPSCLLTRSTAKSATANGGKRPVPAADSINSAVTLTAALLHRQRMLVESPGSAAHGSAAKAARSEAAKVNVLRRT
jgi:hypothetical protein